MKRQIFLQIGIARSCELDFLTDKNKVYAYLSKPSSIGISPYENCLPRECIENIVNPFVVGVDMNPKSVAMMKNKYANNPNIDFLNYAVLGDERKSIVTNGWDLEKKKKNPFPELAIKDTRVPATNLGNLLAEIQNRYNGEIVGVVMDFVNLRISTEKCLFEGMFS